MNEYTEYTIMLHTFAGLAPNAIRAICIGLAFLFLIVSVIAGIVAECRPYRALRCLAVIVVNLVLMVAILGITMGLPRALVREDVVELELAAGVSGITGWTGDNGVTDITYTQDGKVNKGQILVSGDRATLRIPKQTAIKDKVANSE